MRAIFAGTFDPPTLGHLDVVKRAIPLFEKLYIVIAQNVSKKPLLEVDARIKVFKEILKSQSLDKKCEVLSAPGLVADLCQELKADYFIRGVRSSLDLERELPMSLANEMISKGVTTLLIPSTKEHSFVSSSLVREISFLKGDISSFVPKEVVKFLNNKNKKVSKK